MKIVSIVVFSFLFSMSLQAQDAGTDTSSGLTTGKYRQLFNRDFSRSFAYGIAVAPSTPNDTVQRNEYGDLRKDDAEYNTKSPWWLCASRVVLNNALTVGFDRYVLDADFRG
jgi:hypothetical protein